MPKYLVEPSVTSYGYFSCKEAFYQDGFDLFVHCPDDAIRQLLLSHTLLPLVDFDLKRLKSLVRITDLKNELYHRNIQDILSMKRADDD